MRRRTVVLWLVVGWLGFAVLPWNAIGGQGFAGFQWLATWPLDARTAPAIFQLVKHGRLWLLPLTIALALPLLVLGARMQDRTASRLLIVAGTAGLATLIAIAFAIDITGWAWRPLAEIFGDHLRRLLALLPTVGITANAGSPSITSTSSADRTVLSRYSRKIAIQMPNRTAITADSATVTNRCGPTGS